jgi:hypothetical protein
MSCSTWMSWASSGSQGMVSWVRSNYPYFITADYQAGCYCLMNRAQPVGNKFLQRRVVAKQQEQHRRNVSTAKPVCRAEVEEGVELNNRKKELLMEEKYTEIERENRILLEKITRIMGKPAALGGRRKRSHRSLNFGYRKRQMEDIELQNFKMLKRIQEQKSCYNTSKSRGQWLRKEEGRLLRSRADSLRPGQEPRVISSQDLEIDGHSFRVSLIRDRTGLCIEGYDYAQDNYKIIKVPWEEARPLLQQEGLLLDSLRFSDDKLYLIV